MCNKFSSGNIRKYTCINVPSDQRKIYILDTCRPEIKFTVVSVLSGLIYQGDIQKLTEKSFLLQMFLFKLELNLDSWVDTRICDRPSNKESFSLSFLSCSLGRSYIKAENWNLYLKILLKYCANIV